MGGFCIEWIYAAISWHIPPGAFESVTFPFHLWWDMWSFPARGVETTSHAKLWPLRICVWSICKRWHNVWVLAIWKRVNSNGSMILWFFSFGIMAGQTRAHVPHRPNVPYLPPPRNKGLVIAGLIKGNQWGSRLTSHNGIEGLTFFGGGWCLGWKVQRVVSVSLFWKGDYLLKSFHTAFH